MIVRVRGWSMSPTLRPGDLLWTRKPGSLTPGQIIVFRHDQGLLIKRIVERPGEAIGSGNIFLSWGMRGGLVSAAAGSDR